MKGSEEVVGPRGEEGEGGAAQGREGDGARGGSAGKMGSYVTLGHGGCKIVTFRGNEGLQDSFVRRGPEPV